MANSCAIIRSEIDRGCGLLDRNDAGRPGYCSSNDRDRTQTGAVASLAAYYAALSAHDYRRAYRLWDSDGAASGKSFEQFRQGFDETMSTKLELGKSSTPEGAAGCLYVTVPVVILATTRGGTRQKFTGHYVLKRANDVPGASPEQREWRIASASLQRVS